MGGGGDGRISKDFRLRNNAETSPIYNWGGTLRALGAANQHHSNENR